MNIGEMRQRVVFQEASIPSVGGSLVWTTRWELWGAIETLFVSSSEKTRLSLDQNATHRLVVRYDRDKVPVSGMRVICDDKNYMVRMVTVENEAKQFVSILLREMALFDGMSSLA